MHHFEATEKRTAQQIYNHWNSRYANNEAGYLNKINYITIGINYDNYLAHRLIWLYMTGYMPENDIDHIDQNPSNNKWDNLRHVSHQCNMQNQSIYKNNKSGVTGVGWHNFSKKWRSYIMIDKKLNNLGYYENFIDAVKARYDEEQNNPNWTCSFKSTAFIYLKENNLL